MGKQIGSFLASVGCKMMMVRGCCVVINVAIGCMACARVLQIRNPTRKHLLAFDAEVISKGDKQPMFISAPDAVATFATMCRQKSGPTESDKTCVSFTYILRIVYASIGDSTVTVLLWLNCLREV